MVLFYAQTSKHTQDIGAIQKGADFVKSFALGFDVNASPRTILVMHALILDAFLGCDCLVAVG